MKKVLLIALAVYLLTACSEERIETNNCKVVTFSIGGDFSLRTESFTRALEADGSSMTDVWVLDYVGSSLVQQIHQSSNDNDFGTPSISLGYGEHHVYFVASRGQNPSLDTESCNLTFSRVSDTFYKDYAVNVSSSTSGNIAVTLDRIVAKLRVVINDEVPSNAAALNLTPHTWYYGFNYTTAAPVAAQTDVTSSISLPSSVLGTTGVTATMFTFSTASWATTVAINSTSANDDILGSISVANVPFSINTITTVSGNLYSSAKAAAISLNTSWGDGQERTW